MPCCGLHCTLVCKEASKDMNTEPLYTQGQDEGDGQDDGDARGHHELINTVNLLLCHSHLRSFVF